MEREERWIATVREKLRGADESLPEGGWEALERDLAAAGRRRRAFTPAWKKIAAVAAVVAIAVLIGETVVNQGVVDGDRQTTFFAGELTTADGQLLYDDEPLRNEAPTALSEAPAPLAAKVRQALAESRPAAIVAADGSVRTLSGDAVAEVRSSRSETEAAAPSDAEPSAAGEEAVAEEKEAQPAAKAAASRSSERTIARTLPGEAARRSFEPERVKRRTSVGLFAAGLPTAQQVSSGRATPLASASPSHVLSSSGIFRMKRGYDDYLYRHKQPLSFGISVRKEFGYGLSLESGLVYSLLRSDVRVSQNDESFSQTLHMLGIPLRLEALSGCRRNGRKVPLCEIRLRVRRRKGAAMVVDRQRGCTVRFYAADGPLLRTGRLLLPDGNRVADGPDGFAGQFVFAVGRASDLLRRFR